MIFRMFRLAAWLVITAASGAAAAPAYYGAFRELRLTNVTPQGWIAEFLSRQKNGLSGRHEASGYPFNTVLWMGVIPKGGNPRGAIWGPYEQTAYLVDGIYRAGLLLRDPQLTEEGRKNVRFVLDHPQEDGRLGPRHIGRTQWPFVVFTRAVMAEYQATGDATILDKLRAHYRAVESLNAQGEGWVGDRDVCIVEGLCWTYGRTGDKALLDLALRVFDKHRNQYPAGATSIKGHGVTISEVIKQPAILYLYTNDRGLLERSVDNFRLMERDHMLADGIPSSQEGVAGSAPDKTHETCVISDYTWSMGYMLMATGAAEWGDKIERAVFNAGFGAIRKDFKAHEYFASPNQVIAVDGTSPSTHYMETARQSYRPAFDTECCTGNVHRFLPNYVARMWMDDGQGGLAATLYGPSTVKTEGPNPLFIEESTNYPFDDTIAFRVRAPAPAHFALRLRIPEWCHGASIRINGKVSGLAAPAGTFVAVERRFSDGDVITLRLPMKIRAERTGGGVAIARGPLVYVLKIKENWQVVPDPRATEEFPSWALTPGSPWNYALAMREVETKAKVTSRRVSGFPWTEDAVPVTIQAPAHRAAGWQQSGVKNPALPASVQADRKAEMVRLIPYGSTGLRLTVFPEIR
jgi:hypothetical protein